ncbi:MAG: hypothetical protein EXX96DRAFT_549172 [Benjaminiella poitrasii]|nr:MAG: hypothetical protein EXX96DRAFT_549172 [Benjaminiella poitrasii]
MTDTKIKNTNPVKQKSKTTDTKTNEKKDPETKKLVPSKKTEKDGPKELTPGEKLLKTMTAQKAAKKALVKGVKNTHVSFDDEGNGKVETVVQKITPAKVVQPKKTDNKSRPAMKKPEPMKKKRKAEDSAEENVSEESKNPPKKAKKPKKAKTKVSEDAKKDAKQEEVLAYVHLFVNDRSSWKFKKVLQIWLLQHLYEIPEKEFDNVLKYLKDLQGSAREKAKKEAEDKIPAKKESATSHLLTGYSDVNKNDDFDDFDAEKLLAQAVSAPPPEPVTNEEEDESSEIKRARLIFETLS